MVTCNLQNVHQKISETFGRQEIFDPSERGSNINLKTWDED